MTTASSRSSARRGTIGPAIVHDLAEGAGVDRLACSTGPLSGRGRRRRARRGQGRRRRWSTRPSPTSSPPRCGPRAHRCSSTAPPTASTCSAMEGALGAGCHYLDLGGLYHITRRQLELDDRFARRGPARRARHGRQPGQDERDGTHGPRTGSTRCTRCTSRPRRPIRRHPRTGWPRRTRSRPSSTSSPCPPSCCGTGKLRRCRRWPTAGTRSSPAHRPAPDRLHPALRAGDVPRRRSRSARGQLPAVAGAGAGGAGRGARPVRAGRHRAGRRRRRDRGAASRPAGHAWRAAVPPSRPRTARPPCTWSMPRA